MNPRFAAVPGIRSFDFGDEWVVFNPLSWDAHLLNPAAAVVLDLLDGEALDADAIAATLREVLVESEQAAAAEHAQRLIGDLLGLGLVRPVDTATVDGNDR